MNSPRFSFSAACTALALAFFSLGCATSRHPSTTQAHACPHCTITVAEHLALPVSNDQAVARIDQNWTVLEHSCSCCAESTTVFFAGADYADACRIDESSGLCCVDTGRQSGSRGLAQVNRE